MAILYCKRVPKSREMSGTSESGRKISEQYVVRTDSPTEPLALIGLETGVDYGHTHPDDPDVRAESFSIKAADDSALLYLVTWEYARPRVPEPEEGDPEEDPIPAEPGTLNNKRPFWGANSSTTTGPVFKDANDRIITNSAGDPLEDLSKEYSEHRLSLTQYYETHDQQPANAADPDMLPWAEAARFYTNRVNSNVWNGGEADTWKCQGCSAKLNFDENGNYWEVTWEFAYRAEGWQLRVWDVGFHELVDDYGDPVERFDDGSAGDGADGPGGDCPDDASRRVILGQDGKPVRHPVALRNGVAKEPCQPPDELLFFVYLRANFARQFGELNTPV